MSLANICLKRYVVYGSPRTFKFTVFGIIEMTRLNAQRRELR